MPLLPPPHIKLSKGVFLKQQQQLFYMLRLGKQTLIETLIETTEYFLWVIPCDVLN